jgi:hypothetical protein
MMKNDNRAAPPKLRIEYVSAGPNLPPSARIVVVVEPPLMHLWARLRRRLPMAVPRHRSQCGAQAKARNEVLCNRDISGWSPK